MRLIDADELRELAIPCEFRLGALTDLGVPLYQIDNAPTVELDESVIQSVLNKRCMTAVTNEYLIALHGKRPHGEWLHPYVTDIACECSICHVQMPTYRFNFCPNCGAEMRKEIEE